MLFYLAGASAAGSFAVFLILLIHSWENLPTTITSTVDERPISAVLKDDKICKKAGESFRVLIEGVGLGDMASASQRNNRFEKAADNVYESLPLPTMPVSNEEKWRWKHKRK